ncbi:MAG: polyribonucleotide nucleotidyltransferase, partial [Ilumatobacteraceae bacterium]
MLAGGLEACKVWIKESIALQRQLVASVIATHGPITPLAYTPQLDYAPEVLDAVAGLVSQSVAKAITISAKAERNAATDAAAAEAIEALC